MPGTEVAYGGYQPVRALPISAEGLGASPTCSDLHGAGGAVGCAVLTWRAGVRPRGADTL
eukprot:536321-Rhodomonas_salina.1